MDELTEKRYQNQPDYLLAMHVAASGNQAEDAGCDETPVVMITLKLLNLHTLKTSSGGSTEDEEDQNELQIIINPRTDVNDSSRDLLTNESKLSLGLSEEDFVDKPNLIEAIEAIDKWLTAKNLRHISQQGSNDNGQTFQCLLDGYLSFRLVLHSDLTRVNFDQFSKYPFLLEYFDIRKIFCRLYKGESINQSLNTMLHYLQMSPPYLPAILMKQLSTWTSNYKQMNEVPFNEPDDKTTNNNTDQEQQPLERGQWPREHCRDLVRLAVKLTQDSETWKISSFIQNVYQPALIKKTTIISDDVVVRARGLPWQATDNEIHKFFRGITIAPGGIALVLGKVGRRNGEALIALANLEQRDLALRKHKHHINSRYIEIYTALSADFLDISGCETIEAEQFLVRLTSAEQSLVRIRGLPYNVTPQEIVDFFAKTDCPVQFETDGILLVNRPDGKSTGDAFVMFANREISTRALLNHRQHIGQRYIELFKSTPAEVHQVMNSTKRIANRMVNPANCYLPTMQSVTCPPQMMPFDGADVNLGELPMSSLLPILAQGYPNQGHQPNPVYPGVTTQIGNPTNPPGQTELFDRLLSIKKAFVRLRNVPNDANISDILRFLDIGTQFISFQVQFPMIYRKINKDFSNVIIEVVSEAAALLIQATRNMNQMYIEASQTFVQIEINVSSDLNFIEGQTMAFELPILFPSLTGFTYPGLDLTPVTQTMLQTSNGKYQRYPYADHELDSTHNGPFNLANPPMLYDAMAVYNANTSIFHGNTSLPPQVSQAPPLDLGFVHGSQQQEQQQQQQQQQACTQPTVQHPCVYYNQEKRSKTFY